MSPERKHNILILPLVVFIRIPILLPFFILAIIGEWSEKIGYYIGRKLPSFKRERP